MALDAATYGRVEEAEENILYNLNDVKSTVDTLPEKVGEKLDPVQSDMAQLVESVQKQVDELREIVENSPAGILPPNMLSLSSKSTEDGIKITYKANKALRYNSLSENDNSNYTLSITDKVMFRYSDSNYPKNQNEGVLAHIDDDLFSIDVNGISSSKEKTYTIVGLTKNKTYYISAFPISHTNVYNICAGTNNVNRSKCQWTGTKGTLTVNVTQDYDYKPLGEYTATMTPTAGGQAITKTQSGAATVVFSGLEAGQYTLSFSEVAGFTKPSNQSATVVAGQSESIKVSFIASHKLADYTWKEIINISNAGVANTFFSVSDTKSVEITSLGSIEMEIAAFNNNLLSESTSAKKAPISFVTKNIPFLKEMNSLNADIGFHETSLSNYLNNDIFNGIEDEDLKNNIKTVYRYLNFDDISIKLGWISSKIWCPSIKEIISNPKNTTVNEKGTQYSIFTKTASRKKTYNGSPTAWWTSSRSTGSNTKNFSVISGDGSQSDTTMSNNSIGVCFGFCI